MVMVMFKFQNKPPPSLFCSDAYTRNNNDLLLGIKECIHLQLKIVSCNECANNLYIEPPKN